MSTDLMAGELSRAQFEQVSRLLYDVCGIKLGQGKEGLVKSRLMKLLRERQLGSFGQYLDLVERDQSGKSLTAMIDALTTNKTSFFREAAHFDFLRRHVLPALPEGHQLRLWSAGCSSGEEPYTLAIVLREALPDIERRDVRILATDISTKVLARAREAVYEQETVTDLPPQLLHKHFTCVRTAPARAYQVKNDVRAMVHLAQLNLMGEWPMRGPFDAIFCRNVMIYFDKPTQQRLVQRFWQLLAPGGYLFVGHSESLTTSSCEFRYRQPAVYQK